MVYYFIKGKGVVKKVNVSKKGLRTITLPEDWDCEAVRVYRLNKLKFKGNL